jgi:hypothetical protein
LHFELQQHSIPKWSVIVENIGGREATSARL